METSHFESGIYEYHQKLCTNMELHFTLESRKIKYYQDYGKADIDNFIYDLSRQSDPNFCTVSEY